MGKELTELSADELAKLAEEQEIRVAEVVENDNLTKKEKIELLQEELARAKRFRRRDFCSELARILSKTCHEFRRDNKNAGCNQKDVHRALAAAVKMT